MMELKMKSTNRFDTLQVSSYNNIMNLLILQKLLNAFLAGNIDEMVALLASGIDINTTFEVFLISRPVYFKPTFVIICRVMLLC